MPKSREEQIEAWLPGGWKLSASGRALWKNLREYNLAVWEDESHSGQWVWRFKPVDADEDETEYSPARYSSEKEAKRAVLNRLADELGL